MDKLLLRAGALALCLAIGQPANAAPASEPAVAQSNALTAEQWRQDLAYLVDRMEKRHINLFHSVSREKFTTAVAELNARIPALRRHEIIVGMMRIVAMVGDGHTNMSPLKDKAFGFRSLPLKLYLFEDGLFIRATAPGQTDLLGSKVEAIGGVPVAEAIKRAAELSPRDNEITPKLYVPIFLGMPEILHALRMSASPDEATLTVSRGGRKRTVKVFAGDIDPTWPPDTDISLVTPEGWSDARTDAPQPLWLQAPLDYHRMVDLPLERTLYVQLNMVTNIEGQTLSQFGARVRERIKNVNPQRIVLDLRLNRGGNQELRHSFIADLIKSEDEDTRLYVLSWRGSFSATQPFLDDLSNFTDAVLIGEPASSKPNSYGDSYRDVLPNSGLTVRTSIKWHQFGRDEQPWTPIDVAVPYRFADYAAGRDPVLSTALNYVTSPPLPQQALAATEAKGPTGASEVVDRYLADATNRYADRERSLVTTVQDLNRGKQPEAAFAIAERGTRQFAQSADLWTMLALMAEVTKRPDIARKSAERVLELRSDDRTARSLLDRLTAVKGR